MEFFNLDCGNVVAVKEKAWERAIRMATTPEEETRGWMYSDTNWWQLSKVKKIVGKATTKDPGLAR